MTRGEGLEMLQIIRFFRNGLVFAVFVAAASVATISCRMSGVNV